MQPALNISEVHCCFYFLLVRFAIYGERKPGVPHLK